MYFFKVKSMDGFKYTHSFKTKEEAMDFKQMAEEDNTYLHLWEDKTITESEFLYKQENM